MSEVKPLTAEEEPVWREWCREGYVGHCTSALMYERMRRLFASLDASRAREAKLVEALRNVLDDVRTLMKDSHGVAGLHRNGDVASWEEITEGGRYEEWLVSLADAQRTLAALAPYTPAEMPSDVHPQEG